MAGIQTTDDYPTNCRNALMYKSARNKGVWGGSLGLVVMGDDSCFKGPWVLIPVPYTRWKFGHCSDRFVVKIALFV